MLYAVLNKSMKQHHTKQQLYGHSSPISHHPSTANYAGNKDELMSFCYGLLYLDSPVLVGQQGLTYINSVRTQDAV